MRRLLDRLMDEISRWQHVGDDLLLSVLAVLVLWRHASSVAEEARESLRQASRRFMLYYSQLTPIVYTSVVDSGVLLTIRHLCPPRQRRGMGEAIWEEILERFAAHDAIDFAYPTQRFFTSYREGKPPLRATDEALAAAPRRADR